MKRLTYSNRTYDNVGRQYHLEDGQSFYSVTTCLGSTADKSGIDAWKERVGQVEADRVSKIATDLGTALHDICEKYILKLPAKMPNIFVRKLFLQVKPFLDAHLDNVHLTESFLWSSKLGLAGTVDAVVSWNGVFSVLDFKTAKRAGKDEWIEDYKLQIAIYAWMIYERYNVFPEQGVLVFAHKEEIKGRVVTFNTRNYMKKAEQRIIEFRRMLCQTL